QARLQDQAGRARGSGALGNNSSAATAPLIGKLVDEAGDRLTPTHTRKGSRRYRYYISNRMISGPLDPTGWRLPAAALERQIAGAIRIHLARCVTTHHLLAQPDLTLQAGVETP